MEILKIQYTHTKIARLTRMFSRKQENGQEIYQEVLPGVEQGTVLLV
jgi:hypothetical protein